jgi:outer membrane immunogenic protein
MSAVSTVAVAADLPSRAAPPVYLPPPPIFTWTGAYVGATAGVAFNNDHNFNTVGNNPATAAMISANLRPGSLRDRSTGFTGGGEIGYNYEFGNNFLGNTVLGGGPNGGVVIGIEADAFYDGSSSDSDFVAAGAPTTFHSRTDFVGTVRGRVGYAFDRLLVFGTGGFAYGNVRDSENFFNAAGTNLFTGERNTMRTGFAYGGGIEYALPTASFFNPFHSSAVTLKVEYLHYDLGSSAFLIPGHGAAAGLSYTANVSAKGNLVRAGLNYKFDFFNPPGPVVARY